MQSAVSSPSVLRLCSPAPLYILLIASNRSWNSLNSVNVTYTQMRVGGSVKTQLSYDRYLLVWRWLHVSAVLGHLQVISCFKINNNKEKAHTRNNVYLEVVYISGVQRDLVEHLLGSGHQNLHETYQCRMWSRKFLIMGRENARNM